MKIGRALGAVAAAAGVLGLASAAYQAVGEARDRRRSPPPGRLVDIGGHRLHIVCAGHGRPTVVVIPAIGGSSAAWAAVQRQVAEETAVCVYDRAGLGWSDPWPGRRTAIGIAHQLHALLHGAGIGAPYVLVGHSMGGLLARVFIQLYPGEIAGLALIDSSHPEQSQRLPRTDLPDYPGGALATAALQWTRPLGLQRLVRDLGLRGQDPDWSRHRRADAAELVAFGVIRRESAQLAGGLGDLPLAVLTSAPEDHRYAAGSRRRTRIRSRFYPHWLVLQNELAALSANSTHTVADYGGHRLHRDNPELVAQVVIDLVRRVRSAVE